MKKAFKKISFALLVIAPAFMVAMLTPYVYAASPVPVDLLSAGNFTILTASGITDANLSTITGNIGAYPITGAAILITCAEVTGTIYSSDAAGPLPCRVTNSALLNTAINDMVGTVYGNVAGRAPDAIGLGTAGNIGGLTFAPGVYKWSTDVTIPTSITLSGSASDVWIFQISGNLNVSSGPSVVGGVKVLLSGGAQASNVFWQVGGGTGATLGTYATFNGTILSATQVIMQSGAVLNGRALAQTQVTLDANTVTFGAPVTTGPVFIDVNINGVHDLGEQFFSTISAAISAAVVDDTIHVTAGTYTESPTINKSITLRGSAGAIINGKLTITHNRVTVIGLTITNPTSGYGLHVNNVHEVTMLNNTFLNIGTSLSYVAGSAQAIYVQGSGVGAGDITIMGNTISGVGNINLLAGASGSSAKGIFIGDSNGTVNTDGILISGNTISNIRVGSTKGAYGILVNHGNAPTGPSTTNLEIINNTITDLSGRWSHAIGLEGNTPGAIVTGNSISNIVSSGTDSTGIMFEQNTGATSVTVTGNSIDTLSMRYGAVNVATTSIIDVSRNYWATSSPSGAMAGSLNFTPWYVDQGMTTLSNAVVTPTPPAPTAESSRTGTINVLKVVINDNGRTKLIADFPLFVNGSHIISGETNVFTAPSSVYNVTETTDATYVQTFSGDCDLGGHISLNPGDNKFCIITNDDIGAPVATPPIPPLIDLIKIPNPSTLPLGMGRVTFTYRLRNIGIVPVTNITLTGDSCRPITLVSGDTNSDAQLDVAETWIYTCATTLVQTHADTVVATGWANGISAIDIAQATVLVGVPGFPNTGVIQAPLIHVTKVPDPLSLGWGGGMVTYTNIVTNPGSVALANVRLIDNKCTPINYISGDTNTDGKLDPAEAWIYRCTSHLTKTTTNIVIAEGDASGLTAKDLAIVTVVTTPGFPDTGLIPPAAFGLDVRTITQSLGRGARGEGVTALQEFLIAQNKGSAARTLAHVGATAYFGVLTRAALAEFQASVNITPALGNFGPITREYLRTHY